MHGIGWCSRPPHGKDGFVRKGKFKKASNMNYCLHFSIRVEDELQSLLDKRVAETGVALADITIEEEAVLFEQAVSTILEHDEGKTWAEGNVRIGELILLIDCDTRVPVDCLINGAMEMAESPEVAIIQHASGVMNVTGRLFENAIEYFTDLVYTTITFAVGNGDCAPFVGHNAFLRWKAVQGVSFHEDGVEKFWSDSHVSEDFDISLRLQIQGFIVRLASYHNGGFKEGVSLTVYDELARWEKYAYGCNELVFNPIHTWLWRGPITRLFIRFLWSDIKLSSKTTIVAYIGTYYALASALPLTLLNFFLMGLIADSLDHFYMASWKVFVVMIVIFNGLSPIGFSALRYRLNQTSFFMALWEAIKWSPVFVLYFGGLSYHLSAALLSHLFSTNLEWGSTAKELESGGFFIGMDKIAKKFKYMYVLMAIITGGKCYPI
jgi:cellulose synthase/poly-beta-1,6-N-acetylglucosamine synthase-like glycosyltransferase